jgi:hypothetical protein
METHVDSNDPSNGTRRDVVSPRALVASVAIAVVVCAVAGVFLLSWAYGLGRHRGAGAERARLLSREQAIDLARSPAQSGVPVAPVRVPLAPNATRRSSATLARDLWCFGPEECVRIVWPMEIVRGGPPGSGEGALVFAVRQGANRFAKPGSGIAEFVFDLDTAGMVGVYVRCRFSDECANTLECSIDGKRATWVVGREVFDEWLWEQTPRSFILAAGRHRLTIGACEDGLEFSRVIVASLGRDRASLGERELDGAAPTPPPEFEVVALASEVLPRIGAVEAQAFASDSLVIGSGHRNRLAVFARLNGAGPFDGRINVDCGRSAARESRAIRLDPLRRSVFFELELGMTRSRAFYVPVRIDVLDASGELVARQRIPFISPLAWAILGPFADPEGRGLDATFEPDRGIDGLQWLPEIAGHRWRVFENGECYDSFGVVDFNKVFGLANRRWEDAPDMIEPMVAYAVTFVGADEAHHAPIAFAGDDSLAVWVNGRRLLRHDGRVPVETSRQIVGVALDPGYPAEAHGLIHSIVCKVTQTGYYWHLLVEPDESFPYGRPARFSVVPPSAWGVAR